MKKIAITGPESTAKSSLAVLLAKYYNVPYLPEFARDYLLSKPLGYQCSFNEITFIAKEQMRMEDELSTKHELFFCDTDILVCKIWQQYVFGYCDSIIEHAFLKSEYQVHLLCNVDIPWEFDPLRSNPNDREKLFNLYKAELDKYNKPYRIISGLNQERNDNAICIINSIL